MPARPESQSPLLNEDLVHLVELASTSTVPGSNGSLRRMARRYRTDYPELHSAIVRQLRGQNIRSAKTDLSIDQPLDEETKTSLLQFENPVILPTVPIWPRDLTLALEQLVQEHRESSLLLQAGLAPTRTALFVGEPGVGKTLSARWIAHELNLPLAILDLASVMSSFLGRTGTNVHRVFEFARRTRVVLLLDELDSIAKHRDDSSEIGELKRLVTVLLQEIDAWPEGLLLIGATNHPQLLDSAIWRRFEAIVQFPLPDLTARRIAIQRFFDDPQMNPELAEALAHLYSGVSLSSLENDIYRARRRALLAGEDPIEVLVRQNRNRFSEIAPKERGPLAASLLRNSNMSQRTLHDASGVSRDTIRKHLLDRNPKK